MNFVKKNYKLIIGIVIGAILISGISVYATSTYLASQVDYNKNGQAKVSDALDDLYSKTLTYKNLSTTTTATANNILNGKTAYDNFGNLITGNLSTNCIYSSYNKSANSQLRIDFGFNPTTYLIYYKIPNTNIIGYISYNSNSNAISNVVVNGTEYSAYDGNGVFVLNGNILTSNLSTTGSLYSASTQIYYMASK